MATKKNNNNNDEKPIVEAKGCRLCRYRVAPPLNVADPNSPRKPACCFGLEVNDKVRPKNCEFFTDGDFYILHPDAP